MLFRGSGNLATFSGVANFSETMAQEARAPADTMINALLMYLFISAGGMGGLFWFLIEMNSSKSWKNYKFHARL